MAADDRLHNRIRYWKTQLIDLSKRNRLLYFKPSTSGTVQIVEPSLTDIYHRLVARGQAFQFYPLEPEENVLDFDDVNGGNRPPVPPPPLRADEARSNVSDKRLWRALYSLRQKARTSLQEQGVVTLFVAFGFLEWTEAPASDVRLRSPLLLVPVDLLHESSKANYKLSLFEEDVTLNPALIHKLNTDFGLTLPELPLDIREHQRLETLDLEAYFAEISASVAAQKKWSVIPEAYLALFSFHKISMYKDLEAHEDKACEHPIIRALAGDASRLRPTPNDLPCSSDLDRVVTPSDTFQILDADSSQQEAIQAAKRGVSLILQGPPGTGKSQTIANIIAECLANRKKVLFVSEKMAALNVVYRRLSDSGLGEFCLQAHSHKANKKEVVRLLGGALDAPRRAAPQAEADYTEFLRLKERLNAYVAALHIPHPPLNRTAYQAHGELARLKSAPDLHFQFENAASATPADLTRINELLAELARLHDIIVAYNTHPWFGVQIRQYNPNEVKADIRAHFGSLVTLLDDLEERASALAAACGVCEPSGLTEIDRLAALAELLAKTPRPPAAWFAPGAPAPLIAAAQTYQARFTDYRRRRETLLQVYRDDIFLLKHDDLAIRLTARHQAIFERVTPGAETAADGLVRHRNALETALAHVSQLLERLRKSAPALAAACCLDAPASIVGVAELCKTAELLARDPKPQADWFARPRLLALKSEVEDAHGQYDAYIKARDQIQARYDDEFLALDHPTLLARFTGPYASVLRVLNPGYYRDLRLVRAEMKTPGKLRYEEAVRDLKAGRQFTERRRWIEERQAGHARDFGRHFNGLETDWGAVADAVETCRQIVDRLGEERVPNGLIQLLTESGPAIERIRTQRGVVHAEISRLEQELAGLQRLFSFDGLPFTDRPIREADMGALKEWTDATAASVADFLAAWDAAAACRKTGETNDVQTAALVTDVQEARSLIQIERDVQAHATELQVEFGHLFAGMETQWEQILAALDWTGHALDWFGAMTPPVSFVEAASGQRSGAERAGELAAAIRAGKLRADEKMTFLFELFPSASLSVEGKPFDQAPLPAARAWTQTRLDRLPDLDRWMDFQSLRGLCQQAGLVSFLAVVCRDKPAASVLRPAFYKRFWALWLDAVYQSNPALASFDGQRHEEQIARFRELDRSHIRQARSRLRERLLNERPIMGAGSAPTGEMSILLREKNKKARIKPLRRLFAEIPNLLLALKPCLLMSPLSVATFLDSDVIEFDVVIFDEASQICSEDAVGAIMRGRQVIVVGDSKQLPPTRFFAAGVTDDYDTEDEEEEAASEVYESILDECATIGLPDWMLRWHYRSRCEALIAFSNHHLYKDKLVTFPGPYVQKEDGSDRCVEFVFVPDGVYMRGKETGAGTNRTEARKVAELVFRHFDMQPQHSLGVIAFSERQQTAIDDEIRRLRNLKPEYERFFAEEGEEPFFIKNLENVQGDERNSIIFSIGYGRDQTGKMTMNFGPLNKDGGERRLNVAVTRAKHQVKLVSSIQPQDMDLTRTQAKGPALLKNYMEFAQRGPSALAREIQVPDDPEFDSPFEEEVCCALEERRLTVHRQVGCAGYRIDLAIVDDAHPGRYLLGVECDGATYHSSKTARDRDRLRQQILEDMGWRGRILRIWSSDWIRDREAQITRVIQALEAARQSDVETAEPENAASSWEEEQAATTDDSSVLGDPQQDGEPENLSDGVIPYRTYPVKRMGQPADFYYLAENQPGRITDVLIEVVQCEGPIHIAEATRRVVACWGMGKAGSNLLRYVQIAASRAENRGAIVVRDDFLWPCGLSEVVVRVPSDGGVRDIEQIPLEEIAQACYLCVQNAFGIQRAELCTRAARLLGYNRTGSQVHERIEQAIDLCVKQERIEASGDTVRVSRK